MIFLSGGRRNLFLLVYICIVFILSIVRRKANQKGRHKIGSINNKIHICMNNPRRPHRKTRNEIDEEACKKRRSTRIARKFNFSKVYTGDQIKVIDDDDLQIIDRDAYHKELRGTFHQQRRPTHSPPLQDVDLPSNHHPQIAEIEELPILLNQDELAIQENQQPAMTEKQQQCNESMQSLKRQIDCSDPKDTQQRLKKKLKLNQKIESMHGSEGENQPLLIDLADVSQSDPRQSENMLSKQIELSIEELELISSKTNTVLKQKVAQEIQSLLRSDTVPLQQIFNDDSFDISVEESYQQSAISVSKKKQEVVSLCVNCQRNIEIQSQLKELFSELLLKEIDLDQLFLEQELLLILDNLNPAVGKSIAKIQKLVDISDNRLLCELILQRVSQSNEQINIFEQYFISKMVRVNNEWFAILQPSRLATSVRDHFKYLGAKQLLSVHRERLVSFLIG